MSVDMNVKVNTVIYCVEQQANVKKIYFYHSLYLLHINREESRKWRRVMRGGVRQGTHTAYHQTFSHNLPKPQKNK